MDSLSYTAVNSEYPNRRYVWVANDDDINGIKIEIFSFETHKEAEFFMSYIWKRKERECGYFHQFHHRNLEDTKTYCQEEDFETNGKNYNLWTVCQERKMR